MRQLSSPALGWEAAPAALRAEEELPLPCLDQGTVHGAEGKEQSRLPGSWKRRMAKTGEKQM